MKLIASHIFLLQFIAAVQNGQSQPAALSADNAQGMAPANPRPPHVGHTDHVKHNKVKAAAVKSEDGTHANTPNLRVAAVNLPSENSNGQPAAQPNGNNRSEPAPSDQSPPPAAGPSAAPAPAPAPASAPAPAPAPAATPATPPPAASPPAPAPLSPTDQCLQACAAEDTGCKSKCVRVPNPTQDDMKQNIECVGNCFKANPGSAGATALIPCLQQCTVQYTSTFDPSVSPTVPNNSTSSSGNSTDSNASSSKSSSNKTASSSGSSSDAQTQIIHISTTLLGLLVTCIALM
ncbi:hypothetical protein CONCODRAFT_168035 [Conidiobolus coronatus NRRL 28638]|uniref:Extracellular membrane protein CFEM domain-containing protein n=1 Tax=Conidiobolus coronatus (strain ATCC 28846 / CBS 209.66 / NRRL 28638) TaxID=796925 RepID=A0A137PD50_CONC2|nr:hypothetical protein CONCODRAFT_168035 [Conidiobolus coronatus NRRL 28638]|eukprot:KXN72926.1 hypothetical protein CONCODRAFT_168035 [Conidiobolus coronatus NRRL 28638]